MGCGASAIKEDKLVNQSTSCSDLVKVRSVKVLPAASPNQIHDDYDKEDKNIALPNHGHAINLPNLFPKSRTSIKGVRTTLDSKLNPQEALEELRKGNRRFLSGNTYYGTGYDSPKAAIGKRRSLATDGQHPMAAIIGCADSRVPIEIVFDAQPGDLFVLRNAGNTCMCAEGSIVGSAEYCIGHLHTPLIVVLGHTKCGALAGATQLACGQDREVNVKEPESPQGSDSSSNRTMLESLLTSLETPVLEAAQKLPKTASLDEIAALAIRCNVLHTMKSILMFSDLLREKVNAGTLQIQGAVYDIMTGEVEFLDPLPQTSI